MAAGDFGKAMAFGALKDGVSRGSTGVSLDARSTSAGSWCPSKSTCTAAAIPDETLLPPLESIESTNTM